MATPSRPPEIQHYFTSGIVQVRDVLEMTKDAMHAARLDQATCDTSQIILGEVLNNVVEHAYKFEEGHPIELSIWIGDTGVQCSIRDHGGPMPNGVPPAGILAEIDTRSRDDLPEGGFGWAMVNELTEDLRYFRIDGQNELVFRIPTARP
ncbi:ATP-binding protein [Jannaschia sp. CCS1]|uniref:ATP-binding protein n=1 Tax=Jannaschia sp. (strain CCS1) TaxID=290400 RepID=UPI00140F9299|nr:ATP-binding protein [Jannaschia sp. CCS1]